MNTAQRLRALATPATVKTDAESIRSELFLIARKDQLTDRDRMIIGDAISVIASKQAAPVNKVGALRWWRPKSAAWPSAPPKRPRKSRP